MKLTEAQIAEFETYVEKLMGEHKIPGAAVGIALGDEVVYSKGFGVKDLITKAPVTTRTMFGIASLTKSFTCAAIMKLAEEGKLSVHDPIVKYLPEFGAPNEFGGAITAHHCMTHTGGFPPLPALDWGIIDNTKKDAPTKKGESAPQSDGNTDDPERAALPHPPVTTYKQLLDYMRTGDFQMLGKPGEYCSYSNDCYGVLGAVIEKVTGEFYGRYMEQNILGPLGMKRSTFNLEEMLKDEDVTTLYYREDYDGPDGEIYSSNNWQVAPSFMACGWLKSCVDDLLNYTRYHATKGSFNGIRLLSGASLDDMSSPRITYTRDKMYGYGFGIQADYNGVTVVDHGGGLKGVSSQLGWVKDKGISAVVLTNLSGAPSSKIMAAALNTMLGLPLDTPRSVYNREDWPAEEIESLTGTFKSGEGGQVAFANEEGKLMACYGKDGKAKFEVRRDRKDLGVVTIRGSENEVRFLRDGQGDVWAIASGGRVIRKS